MQLEIKGRGYIVQGSAEKIPVILGLAKVELGSPDVYVRDYRTFGIDDARELRERAQGRALHGECRVFVIVTPQMTVDAQNALLKTLEEPPADAAFFFVVPSPTQLLQTLRSRTQILVLEQDSVETDGVKKFLAATPEKRLDMMKELASHDENDERDLRGALAFLQSLEEHLAPKKEQSGAREAIRSVYRARKYLGDKGALVKPLLEQVALLTPRL